MSLVQLIFSVILIVHSSMEECTHETFKNIQIHLKYNNINQIQHVTGCITPETLIKYDNNLDSIQINGQNIPQLNEEAVANFSDDFSISFQNNNIHTIKKGAFFNLNGLKSITITKNNLSVIEVGAFANLPSLKGIYLNKNKLSFLEANTFQSVPMLLTVELQNNRLEYFEKEWFSDAPMLDYIDLSYNFICSIPRAAFSTLSSLELIDMKYNKIQQIHKNAFEGLENAIYIDLSHNSIEQFNVDLKPLKNIEELIISTNKLTYIPENVLNDIAASIIKIFLVFPNPIQCLCYDKLNKWGFDNNIRLGNYSTECVNKNNPVCISLPGETTECLENIDHDTNEQLSKRFYANFNSNCEDN